MTTAAVVSIDALLGGLLLTLVLGVRQSFVYRRERRNLASAFIGEIVAVVHAMESDTVVREIEAGLAIGLENRNHHLTLPHPLIYESSAAKLNHFNAPIPRKIAHFFDGLPTVVMEIGDIASEGSTEAGLYHARQLRSNLKDLFAEADDLLLELDAVVAPHSKARHIA
jgi:hypothetical protein